MSKRRNTFAPAGRRVETVAGFLSQFSAKLKDNTVMLVKHNFKVTAVPRSDVTQQEHAFSSCVKLF